MDALTDEEIEAAKVKINEIRCPKCKDRKNFIARDGVLKTCYEC